VKTVRLYSGERPVEFKARDVRVEEQFGVISVQITGKLSGKVMTLYPGLDAFSIEDEV
jgi:hypothetical protein